MPPKKETPSQKSARFSQRSASLNHQADFQLLVGVMKQAPSSVGKIKQHLVNLAYLDNNDQILVNEVAINVPAAESPQKTMMLEYNLSDKIPFGTAESSSPYFLQFLLVQLEPVACSKHSMRALLRKGQRRVPVKILLEILDMMTDWPADGDWSQLGTIGKFIDHLNIANEEQGPRCRDLIFPCDWASQGVFKLSISGGQHFLEDRYMKISREITCPVFKQAASLDPNDYVILKNFSRSRATLQKTGVLQTLQCSMWVPMGPATSTKVSLKGTLGHVREGWLDMPQTTLGAKHQGYFGACQPRAVEQQPAEKGTKTHEHAEMPSKLHVNS